jgi:acylphosphatase
VAALVYYTGRVQGVGFRATAADLARSHDVTGWVKNLPDGRVCLFAEGPRADVEGYLRTVRRQWGGHVHAESVDWQAPTGRFHSFDVVR